MQDSVGVPASVQRFVKTLVVTAKAVLLYPPSSNIPLQTAKACADALATVFADYGEFALGVTKDGLTFEGRSLLPEVAAYRALAVELYQRHLAEVVFREGTGPKELVGFLSVLSIDPAELEAAGGFESRLWELGVSTITVAQATASLTSSVVDFDADLADISDEEALAGTELDDAPPLDRTHITLQRFMSDRQAIARRLLAGWGGGGQAGLDAVAAAFAELAELAASAGSDEERSRMAKNVGSALELVDAPTRRQILAQRILAEATTNPAMGGVMRELGAREVARLLLGGVTDDDVSRAGIARAIRLMSRITGEGRETTASVFGEVMAEQGISAALFTGVLQDTAPTRVVIRNAPHAAPSPVTAAVRLVNIVPSAAQLDPEQSEEIRALLDEVQVGISDGDVVMALISLCFHDAREAPFASTMSVLEDALDLLLERGEIEKAAEAVEALGRLAKSPTLSDSQRRRAELAVGRLTKPSDVQAIVGALRHSAPGSREHQAARRLLDGLGPHAIDSLVVRLAEEPDMAMRKTIVDVLSEIAAQHVDDLGGYISDPRWYVVRNVVSVLGSVKDPRVVPYLLRAQHHLEARVRREAVRAIGGLQIPEAVTILISSLADADAQVVQLAARFLGAAKATEAVGALAEVARGQGGGNRENGPRCEAIDALARTGSPEAISVLQSLCKRGVFRGTGSSREVRSAAESALNRIQDGHGGAS